MNSVEQFIKNKAEEVFNEVKFREKQLIEQLKKIYGKQCLERISKKKDLILRVSQPQSTSIDLNWPQLTSIDLS